MQRGSTGQPGAHDHARRRERARELAVEEAGGALLVTDPKNVRYLTGFAGTNGQLLLGRDAGDDQLVTDHRYVERAGVEAPDLAVTVSREPIEVAVQRCAGWKTGLGLEADHLTWALGEQARDYAHDHGVTVTATSQLVERLRELKDGAELARLRQACATTQEALEWLVGTLVEVGRTERELAVALERRFLDMGAEGVAFPSIVASGPNAAVPHHAPGDRSLVPGDLLTVDCGAIVDGYHADHTRTYAIDHVRDDLAEVHALVVAAQAAGCAAAVAGASGNDVDAAARQVIVEGGYGERFLHGTGHGVGLEIHEAPEVAEGAAATLRPGVTLTVEPGVYLSGIGGVRIEDTLLIVEDGPPQPLTDTPRSLRIL